jgi:hypothetical protein
MPITVRRLPKQPAADRTLTSRIIEWVSVTLIAIGIGLGGEAIGFLHHPIVAAVAISVGNIIGQCSRVIIIRRRKKKNGITR